MTPRAARGRSRLARGHERRRRQRRRHLWRRRTSGIELTGVGLSVEAVDDDATIPDDRHGARTTRVALRHAVVRGEDGDTTPTVARVVLDLPRLRRADHEPVTLHAIAQHVHELDGAFLLP